MRIKAVRKVPAMLQIKIVSDIHELSLKVWELFRRHGFGINSRPHDMGM